MDPTELTIRSFESADTGIFRNLNEDWIQEHFALEPEDELVLNHPEEHILRQGGDIFIAWRGESPVGCCALIAKTPGVFELGKMAVAAPFRGQGIGRALLKYAIQEARSRGVKTLVLGSNTKLQAAIHLYETSGFRHLTGEEAPALPYERANVFMRLDFDIVTEGLNDLRAAS